MAVILTKYMQEPRFCAYSYVLVYGQEHKTLHDQPFPGSL